jgi:hypothetical protein
MKGTIDVQIKHKDGSTETRHERNVVFDLPALVLKHNLEMPDWMHVLCGNSMNPGFSSSPLKEYSYFALSEDECSLTRPEYRPFALVGVQSNATQWYQSVPSRVVSEKSITLQESWTIGTPITLRGIAMYRGSLPMLYDSYSMKYLDGSLYCLYVGNGYSPTYYQKADFSMDIFSYNNPRANGFASYENDVTHCSIGCLPYVLANPSERIAFLGSNGNRSTSLPVSTSASIAIYKYPDDNTLLRSFKLSQFTGFTTGYYDTTFLMNTGTKNYLFEVNKASSGSSTSLIQSITAWQIPDTAIADSETIAPVKTDFLSEFWPTTAGTSYSPNRIIGNYIKMFDNLFKVDDTLTVTQYHGNSSKDITSQQPVPYLSLKDSGITYSLTNDSTGKWNTSYSSFNVSFWNTTAANFSTPIELAEGDVLTVSYKIEVA